MRYLPLVVAAALSMAVPYGARAQAPASAEQQFKQGREAMDKGDFKRALELLRASHKAEPGRGKLVNIALCEEHVGLLGSALRHFQEVLPQLDPNEERAGIVKKRIEAIRPKVATLRIAVAPGAAAGTTVTLDGAPVAPASLDVDMPIDPGSHVIVAAAPGASDKRFEMTIAGSGPRSIEVAPSAAPATPSEAPSSADATPSRGLPWKLGIAGLGAGGALLLAGVGTGAAAIAKHGSVASQCPKPDQCPAKVQGDIDTYNALGAASTGTFIAGGVLAATGLVLVLTSRHGEAKPAEAWVAPVIGAGFVGAQGRF